jgi:hypothetical protein
LPIVSALDVEPGYFGIRDDDALCVTVGAGFAAHLHASFDGGRGDQIKDGAITSLDGAEVASPAPLPPKARP